MSKNKTLLVVLICLLMLSCLNQRKVANQEECDPYKYPYVKTFHIKRVKDKPYSKYKAFYLITEDLEFGLHHKEQAENCLKGLAIASSLSKQYGIHWTHFLDVNKLKGLVVTTDSEVTEQTKKAVAMLSEMVNSGDDIEEHLHRPMDEEMLQTLKAEHPINIDLDELKTILPYRQSKNFFFRTALEPAYKDLVENFLYGKELLEKTFYSNGQKVLAFRPGGWDHGENQDETLIYFGALQKAGLRASSGLASGTYRTANWKVGAVPRQNLVTINLDKGQILELSPNTGEGGFFNPRTKKDLEKIIASISTIDDEIPVIVSVDHLNDYYDPREYEKGLTPQQIAKETEHRFELLTEHFKTVADYRSKEILYPITLRELVSIIDGNKQ
jgi:hypothetical protein